MNILRNIQSSQLFRVQGTENPSNQHKWVHTEHSQEESRTRTGIAVRNGGYAFRLVSESLCLSPSHSPPPSPSPPSSWLPFIPVFFLLSPNLLSLFNYPTLATLGPWPIIHRVDQVPASATSLCLKPSSCVPANPLRTGVLVSQRVAVKLGSIFLPNQPGNTSITMFYIIVTENLFILK